MITVGHGHDYDYDYDYDGSLRLGARRVAL
jgi:hypothetical protein